MPTLSACRWSYGSGCTTATPAPSRRTYLALSATTKASDVDEVLRHYEPFGYRAVVLTKLDETLRIGAVVSTDNGMTWKDLGIVLTAPPDSLNCDSKNFYFVGGNGDFCVNVDHQREYIYFFISTYGEFKEQGVAVARMRYEDRDAPVGKVWKWIVLGIAVGAFIHGYVPENFLAAIMGKEAWWSVPIAVLVGIPMYSNAAGMIPVVQALLGKGAALGTVLAFMMSVIALSLPEIIILRKVLKLRLIITFVGVVGLGILIVGYLFNVII